MLVGMVAGVCIVMIIIYSKQGNYGHSWYQVRNFLSDMEIVGSPGSTPLKANGQSWGSFPFRKYIS